MIENERLELLIKDKKTIYYSDTIEIREIKLNKEYKLENILNSYILFGDSLPFCGAPTNLLFESKGDAKWQLVNAVRIENFYPPTWEEFQDKSYYHFTTPDNNVYVIETVLNFDFNKKENSSKYSIAITNSYDFNHNKIIEKPFTKDGYFEVCKKGKEMFLQGYKKE